MLRYTQSDTSFCERLTAFFAAGIEVGQDLICHTIQISIRGEKKRRSFAYENDFSTKKQTAEKSSRISF